MSMTLHASKRAQQRCISPILLSLLMDFGKREPAGDGVSKMYFDKAARRRVKAYVGPVARQIDEFMNVYAVVGSDGQIITAAHLTERVRRH
jgi:hypothetical protein